MEQTRTSEAKVERVVQEVLAAFVMRRVKTELHSCLLILLHA